MIFLMALTLSGTFSRINDRTSIFYHNTGFHGPEDLSRIKCLSQNSVWSAWSSDNGFGKRERLTNKIQNCEIIKERQERSFSPKTTPLEKV